MPRSLGIKKLTIETDWVSKDCTLNQLELPVASSLPWISGYPEDASSAPVCSSQCYQPVCIINI